ncbi:MAG: hypothetical protein RIS70_1730 [Planctomycetota bacterium]|jgi:hypothetical protein
MYTEYAEAPQAVAVSPAEVAQAIFEHSPHRIFRTLRCSFDDGELVIRGKLPTFYSKQLAQTALMSLKGIHHILNLVEVTDTPKRCR